MNEVFKKRQLSFLLKLGLLTIILGALHAYLFHSFFEQSLFFPIWQIYAFHFCTVLIIYSVINFKYSNGTTVVFNYFMIGTLLKMIIAFLFLLPFLLSEFESKKPDVVNFFLPYFVYLAFEVYSVIFFLKKQQ